MIKNIYNIDLHMHTTVSDGTDSPVDIAQKIREKGIELFSITDHDAVMGCSLARGAMEGEDYPPFINGVEFSCKDEHGKYHVLGYGYDIHAEGINRLVAMGHGFRMEKAHSRLKFLEEEYGFTFSEEEIEDFLAKPNPGKPHLGIMMVGRGYAKSKEEAIRDYINKSPYKSKYLRPEEAIEGILASGGIPVLAHPSYGNGEDLIMGEAMERRLNRLVGYGLRGVEAFYSGFTPKLISEMIDFADKYDLLITAGSDYHGKNKLVALGDTNLTESSPGIDRVKKFIQEVL